MIGEGKGAAPRVDVVIPAYGRHDLVELVLADLEADRSIVSRRVTVVDNRGDFECSRADVRVVRTGRNLRWIGTVNWALETAATAGAGVCVVLNSDVRLSNPFLDGLVRAIEDDSRVAMAAPCYDDYWPHQHPADLPSSAAVFAGRETVRSVPFCDGAAIAFDLAAIAGIGVLDTQTFDWHGYGADIDIAIRARRAGYRVVVTDSCFVSHARHGSGPNPGVDVQRPRHEIEDGLTAKYGPRWRELVGLPDSSLRAEALTAGGDLADRRLVGNHWSA